VWGQWGASLSHHGRCKVPWNVLLVPVSPCTPSLNRTFPTHPSPRSSCASCSHRSPSFELCVFSHVAALVRYLTPSPSPTSPPLYYAG
jgi:hypothetical protein